MSGDDVRADRHILLEFDALLGQIEMLVESGGRERFDSDDHYRWVLHRLWIAVGNEAYEYALVAGRNVQVEQPWSTLYRMRNILAHKRLSEIDEDEVWRMTALRPKALRAKARDLLR